MKLTEEQQNAVNKAVEAISEGTLFRIGGYAGTGKTTIARYIVEAVPNAMVCAFTGKAARRLQEKGLPMAQTLHRTIYDFDPQRQKFDLKNEVYGNYFLIDEGSMISHDLWRDIRSFDKPIVILGDLGQLEPIGRDPELMRQPDVVLEQVHRQEDGSGIVDFANDIRLEQYVRGMEYRDVEIHYGSKPTIEEALKADVVICGYNHTRKSINVTMRKALERKGVLQKSDKVICLKNNIALGVFNGQIFDVSLVKQENPTHILAVCSDNGTEQDLIFFKIGFGKAKIKNKDLAGIGKLNEAVIADYGYAITCHKSQGSEWDSVIVIDQQCPYWDAVRWRYTAITRAAKKLKYYFSGKR